VNPTVYLAGSLFTTAERRWNEWLADALKKRGLQIILPQREVADCISASGVDHERIFNKCLEELNRANAVLAIFDGCDVDSGTAFECGYAYARQIPIVGLRTDMRPGGEDDGVNTMLRRCCTDFVAVSADENPDQLVAELLLKAVRRPGTDDL